MAEYPAERRRRCDKVGFVNRQILNKFLRTARFVGPEILQGNPSRYVESRNCRGFHQAGQGFPVPDRTR